MSKVRVHELAKEIDRTSKEIMDYLNGNGADLKSHMSFLTEQQAEDAKKKFGSAGHTGEAPKKKTIVQVFRPQNTQGGQRRQNARGAQRPGGQQASGRTAMDKEKREGYVSAQERGRDNNRPAKDGNKDRQGRDFRDRDRQGRDGNKDRQGGRNFRDGRDRDRDRQGRGTRDNKDRDRQGRDFRDKDRQGGRDFRDGRDRDRDRQGRDSRDGRDRDRDRQGRGSRDGRNNGPSIPAPMVAEQKPQRRSQKDNYKKKDYDRDDEREGKFGQKQGKGKKNQQPVMEKPQPKKEKKEEQIKQITIPKMLTIKDLADAMKIQPSAIVKKLFLQGKIVMVNQEIDFDTAEEIAMEFDVLCEQEEEIDVIEELLKEEEEDEKK